MILKTPYPSIGQTLSSTPSPSSIKNRYQILVNFTDFGQGGGCLHQPPRGWYRADHPLLESREFSVSSMYCCCSDHLSGNDDNRWNGAGCMFGPSFCVGFLRVFFYWAVWGMPWSSTCLRRFASWLFRSTSGTRGSYPAVFVHLWTSDTNHPHTGFLRSIRCCHYV